MLYSTGPIKLLEGAVKKPKKNSFRQNKDGSDIFEYVVRVMGEGSTPEGMTLRKVINDINPKSVVMTVKDKETGYQEPLPNKQFIVSFTSRNRPRVMDAKGNDMEEGEIPYINDFFGDKATVNVIYEIGEYGDKKFKKLIGIQFLEWEKAPKKEATEPAQRYTEEDFRKHLSAEGVSNV